MERLVHGLLSGIVQVLDVIFVVGILGSAVVLLLSFVDDFKTAMDRD